MTSITLSFHSISFPSEWGRSLLYTVPSSLYYSFHSISFPSEWGLMDQEPRLFSLPVSIQLVSPASGDWLGELPKAPPSSSFHSISFPSEWGL